MAWLPALVLVLGAAAWRQAEALRLPFLADDYLFLDQIRHRGLISALMSRDPLQNYVRPVGRQVYFWVVSSLGASPAIAHVINLVAFVSIVGFLFAITRRLAGARAAAIAAGVLALHYSADVPVRWASGSQDLLAALGALGAVWLFLAGHRVWAGAALAAGILSKETVVLTPFIAALGARRPGEPWSRTAQRAWPLYAAVGVCAVIWVSCIRRWAVEQLSATPAALLAALAHVPQVLVGAEWRRGASLHWLDTPAALGPLLLVAAAVALTHAARKPRQIPAATPDAAAGEVAPGDSRSPLFLGAAWALLAAVPVTVVAPTWNAYYYLFSICGVGLALGALLRGRPGWVGMAVILVLAIGSENGRRLDQFATAPGIWNAQSHLNRFYFDRAMSYIPRYLGSLRRAHPSLPPRSTLFFSNLAPMVAWQGGDGALLRWAYRDSSLRSYYLGRFSIEAARRGPIFVFDVEGDTLEDITWHPRLFMELAMSLLTADHPQGADDALALELERHPDNAVATYWRGWTRLSLGDTTEAYRLLARNGSYLDPGPSPQIGDAEAELAARDTLAAESRLEQAVMHHMLDPAAHAALAHLEMIKGPLRPAAAMEAFAARLLAPGRGESWRRWAIFQYSWGNDAGCLESLQRYFALAGPAGREDRDAAALSDFLKRRLPGGDLAPEALRRR